MPQKPAVNKSNAFIVICDTFENFFLDLCKIKGYVS
jgi:hypothetical protein